MLDLEPGRNPGFSLLKWGYVINIFILDTNPEKAAQSMCDKHVVKMILETAQLLCSAIHFHGYGSEVQYKPTHINHPCSIWSRSSRQNFLWLKSHGLALCDEYSFRYGKTHKSKQVILSCNPNRIPDGNLMPFALAMPDQFKRPDAVESYRNYYIGSKKDIAKWTKRKPPDWWK